MMTQAYIGIQLDYQPSPDLPEREGYARVRMPDGNLYYYCPNCAGNAVEYGMAVRSHSEAHGETFVLTAMCARIARTLAGHRGSIFALGAGNYVGDDLVTETTYVFAVECRDVMMAINLVLTLNGVEHQAEEEKNEPASQNHKLN